MKILLDENMPRQLIPALTADGHEVESVKSLRLNGVDNGTLYELASQQFDLCVTRDAAFVHRIRALEQRARVKLLRVVIPQTRQEEFVPQFILAFRQTDWRTYANGDDWPRS